ncbi:hypothetical protein SAMN05216390_10753 [Lachnospiraceae bacterium KH1T2]|nr:hypothetical protein SAMN05216390_10753 [Lachnospiraceae bacterium KH1T2]
MTKQEAIDGMTIPKTKEQWLAFEEEFYNTLTKEERDEIGAGAMPMVETCGYIRNFMK